MKDIILSLGSFQDKASLHQYLKQQMDFPFYYGANLDALYDELTSATDPLRITLSYPALFEGALAAYLPRILKVFEEAAQENYNLSLQLQPEDAVSSPANEAAPQSIVIKKPTEEELAAITCQPVWSCGVSEFDWHYDEQETCLILEGQVTVESPLGNVAFGPGDYVVFPQGLSCIWKVTAPLKKHYVFG